MRTVSLALQISHLSACPLISIEPDTMHMPVVCTHTGRIDLSSIHQTQVLLSSACLCPTDWAYSGQPMACKMGPLQAGGGCTTGRRWVHW